MSIPERSEHCFRTTGEIIGKLPQFEKYLTGGESLTITNSKDLLMDLFQIKTPEARDLFLHLKTLHHLELENEGTTRRDIVLMEDDAGNTASVIVCRDLNPPSGDRDPAYGKIIVIGGCGIYPQKTLLDGLRHTKLLSVIMRRKCQMGGLDLAGMKATIPQESDWLNSEILRIATGFLFSPNGPFKDAITGSDVGQTPKTIADMARGSEIGGDHQIAGHYYPDLDTPGSCKYSIRETHRALEESHKNIYGKNEGYIVPKLAGSKVLVEAFGRIGRTVVREMLNEGANIIVCDPRLTDEDYLLPKAVRKAEDYEENKVRMKEKFYELVGKYGSNRIQVVRTEKDVLFEQEGEIFCPCSDVEGSLTEERLKKLAKNHVKMILSGSNNPLGKGVCWRSARLAHELKIIFPPEILSNCGSVTAAASEPLFRLAQQQDPSMTAEKFVEERVASYIAQNTRNKLSLLSGIMERLGVDLYTAGEIWFRKENGLPWNLDKNHVLID